jgi:hypothetical protein
MTFEEDFPSLNDPTMIRTGLIHKSDIEQRCLDKQRVKEIIRTLQLGDYNEGLLPDEEGYQDNPKQMIDGDILLQELGL